MKQATVGLEEYKQNTQTQAILRATHFQPLFFCPKALYIHVYIQCVCVYLHVRADRGITPCIQM